MATLAIDKVRTFKVDPSLTGEAPVVASDVIYRGAAVGNSSGNARPLVAGDGFFGFAEARADNATGSAGDKAVTLRQRGLIKLDITGVTGIGDEAATVYASDDDTFTLTVGSNTAIGKITHYVSGTTCWVYFEAASIQSL